MTGHTEFETGLKMDRFPRGNKYDPEWILHNQMGLNPLWLSEWLCQAIALVPGMRVLDLGCGKGISSIFLAKEFGVHVWALDLWIEASSNYERICQASVDNLVYPLHGDARNLPFAEGYFDSVFCTDAFIYFGTDDLYLDDIQRFIKPGGYIGITVPGFMRKVEGKLPEHILPFWAQECWSWHTVDWWRWHWERTGLVELECVDVLPEGWALWLKWKQARKSAGDKSPGLDSDIHVLEADQGQYMGFIRMVGKRR